MASEDTTLQQPVMTFEERPTTRRPGVVVLHAVSSSLKVVRLEPGKALEIGRSAECDLVLADPDVSRRHLSIVREGDGFRVDNLSLNGSVLYGHKLTGSAFVREATDRAHPIVRVASTFLFLVNDAYEYENGRVSVEDGQVLGPVNHRAHLEIDRASAAGLTTLIQAETGSGKDYAATRYHARGPRKDKPFLVVNCASLTENLADGQLFGTRKGAYTGAENRHGLFGDADGGTLFLDEIGELALSVQPKLLRVLQTGDYSAVGSTQRKHADVHIVCATHQDLAARVAEGAFREDLFHRLMQMHVQLPPLRERREEIPTLVRTFLGGLVPTIELLESCMIHPWPGNVRQLQQAMGRMAAHARGPTVSSADLPEKVREEIAEVLRKPPPGNKTAALIAACEANGGDVQAAADSVGLRKSQAYDLLAKAGYKPRKGK
jgi:transcriptional regulator with GAF, ATPase, and Fis domain